MFTYWRTYLSQRVENPKFLLRYIQICFVIPIILVIGFRSIALFEFSKLILEDNSRKASLNTIAIKDDRQIRGPESALEAAISLLDVTVNHVHRAYGFYLLNATMFGFVGLIGALFRNRSLLLAYILSTIINFGYAAIFTTRPYYPELLMIILALFLHRSIVIFEEQPLLPIVGLQVGVKHTLHPTQLSLNNNSSNENQLPSYEEVQQAI